MKKLMFTILVLCVIVLALPAINGCAATQAITDKSGAQLWGENCLRCHNTPSPADFNDAQWEAIGMHMRVRAHSLSPDEINKVVAFLQSGN
ncbi:MAG TPA: cytochrome c [Saprospiraceae bacterium]|nr:cytochrome c [Saprospiraceae bacterium]